MMNGWHQKVHTQQVLERLWRNRNPPTLSVGKYIGAANYGKQYGESFKNKK